MAAQGLSGTICILTAESFMIRKACGFALYTAARNLTEMRKRRVGIGRPPDSEHETLRIKQGCMDDE